MLQKVISGGQTGADRAGLMAAKAVGIPTGGVMPRGFRALDGDHPEFRELYNMDEHTSSSYAIRTWRNVKDSDGTVRFAHVWNSPGEVCTFRAILAYDKPCLDIEPTTEFPEWGELVAAFVRQHKIQTLNVAGNSEKTAPGIQDQVYQILLSAFQEMKAEYDRWVNSI